MHIPKVWTKATAPPPAADKPVVAVWGWGDDLATAKAEAGSKLKRLIERLARGEPFPDKYGYGARPLREEILRTIGDEAAPSAVLTRNAYGAQVLNTARVLFLDIDVPSPGFGDKLRGLFGGKSRRQAALEQLRESLHAHGKATFRVYETAAGYRALAIDREFEPNGADTAALMKATGTDPQFVQLCAAQRSFRARLTPKPWRCGLGRPPTEYPREDGKSQQAFQKWLADYEQTCRGHATCRFVETVGAGSARGFARDVVDLHDRVTRAGEKLPLA